VRGGSAQGGTPCFSSLIKWTRHEFSPAYFSVPNFYHLQQQR
jgi:hypothetical protein